MTITINGKDIDFTLEKEKTAGDVTAALALWLDESGMLIASVNLDDQPVIMAEEEWRSQKIDSINVMNIEAVSIQEGRIRQLETARDYFVLMNRAAQAADSESMMELSDGFKDLLNILPHLLGEVSNPEITSLVKDNLEKAGFPTGGESLNHKLIVGESEKIAMLLESRRKQTTDPEGEARSASLALVAIAGQLDDVAVNLQTGKDKQAMETIIVLTELLQSLMRALSWTGGIVDAEEVVDDLTGILSELEDALKASDTVLIGDLLEYEIKPRLVDIPGRLGFTEEAAL